MVKKLDCWKHVATLIDNKLVVFWLNLLFQYLSENTSGWLQLKKETHKSWYYKGNFFSYRAAEYEQRLCNPVRWSGLSHFQATVIHYMSHGWHNKNNPQPMSLCPRHIFTVNTHKNTGCFISYQQACGLQFPLKAFILEATKAPRPQRANSFSESFQQLRGTLTFRRRIKSRLPIPGIIRRLPYSTRFQDKG